MILVRRRQREVSVGTVRQARSSTVGSRGRWVVDPDLSV